jgi:hypothetical protein
VPTTSSPANPQVTVDMAFSIPMPAGTAPLSGKRVEVVYTHQYVFIGPIAGWFGGSFTSVPVRGVAIMRDEVATPPAGP